MKAEILYDAKINLLRKVKSVSNDEWKDIYNSTKKNNKENDSDKYIGNKIKTYKTKRKDNILCTSNTDFFLLKKLI